ncbi:aspartyl-phosphate phosphatase Spo0E family protein [Bacillus sp. ISL-7]|nr:aspartyl-phosphate phosphatase Spo0E family protein [Bacillus sp. ISL-7]
MVLKEIDELEGRINQLKKELIQITEVTGLNSDETICCSQKLDQLIMIYQKLYKKRK